jgi:hypothetical protein
LTTLAAARSIAAMLRVDVAKTAPGRTNTNIIDLRPIRVTLLDELAQPLAGVRFTLTAGGSSTEGTTDEVGAVLAVVLPGTTEATLEYWPAGDDAASEVMELELGEMQEAGTMHGAAARLVALGFDVDDDPELGSGGLEEALRSFQDLVGLPATGMLDEDTVNMLDQLYGDPS